VRRIALKIKFCSGDLGKSELPRTPLVRASVREPGADSTVARTWR
jgi:hypothetical protein